MSYWLHAVIPLQIDILAEADRMWTVNPKHHRLVVNHHLCLILHGTTSRTINDIEPGKPQRIAEHHNPAIGTYSLRNRIVVAHPQSHVRHIASSRHAANQRKQQSAVSQYKGDVPAYASMDYPVSQNYQQMGSHSNQQHHERPRGKEGHAPWHTTAHHTRQCRQSNQTCGHGC